jgi:Pro-kumamolisin, activation domain/Bacterial Ig-like domain (group 3)
MLITALLHPIVQDSRTGATSMTNPCRRWMTRLTSTLLPLIFALCTLPASSPYASAQASSPAPVVRPLITQSVDETRLTVLSGNIHRLARPEYDLGVAPATLPMQRMLLVLKRSSEQESTLRKLLDNQQDKHSASYHKWMTPASYGQQFGPTNLDIQTITGWLQSHGFEVGTTKGRTVLEFSGSASQVEEAFHTTIHKYLVNGEQHWANSSNPSIPTALTSTVAGVMTLHNFQKKPQLHLMKEPAPAQIVPGRKPHVTFPAQNGQPITNALGPQDYATIYNINPTYSLGTTGSGVTIGVVGRSNLFASGEDVTTFQDTAFELCCSLFTSSNIILNGPDPGDLGGNEEAEATLDNTWSGAVAPDANIQFVVSASTNTADGVDLSEVYIVENNFADIMTESFGSCEWDATDSQLAGTYALAEQAAAQGITYLVSTGDNGAEGCDDPSSPPATGPVSISLLASTPFNIAVGGTMFNEDGDTAQYWGSEPPVEESAISYIPENVWNESSLTNGLWSGSGGASAGNLGNTLVGGTTPGIAKPSWQSGVVGTQNDTVRDIPDVSLTAAGHDPYLLCLEGSCVADSNGQFFIYFAYGTSASAPSFAGIMALVDQQMGGRQGQANYILYRLAASQAAYPAQCDGSNTSAFPLSSCIFNDVTVGNNVVPGEVGSDYQATAGYDLTTGLGSVNVANLVSNWNTVTFNPTSTTLALSPTTNVVHGSSVMANISVVPGSGTGVPTGTATLLAAAGGNFNGNSSLGGFALSNGSAAQSTNNLPGGSYNVTAYYSGDPTYAPSTSDPVSVTVTPEASITTVSLLTFSAQGQQSNFTGGPFGSFAYLRADVAGVSGHGTPTGSVTFSDTFGPIPGGGTFTLNSGEQLNNGSTTATPNGVVTFDTGTHIISANYSGDASFSGSNSAPSQTFTITPGFFALVPTAQSTVVVSAPGSSGQSQVSVAYSTGFSGTISLSCSGLPTGAACIFSPASITATGTVSTTTSNITISTTAATAMLQPPIHPSGQHFLALASFLFFSVMLTGWQRKPRAGFLLALVLLILFIPACGGSSNSSQNQTPPPPPPPPATSAGTYNITVNATSGSTTSPTGFVLVVQ